MDRMLTRWVIGCAAAEAVGITVAAAAARAGDRLVGTPASAGGTATLVALAVAAGVVEAVALAAAMAAALRSVVPALPRARWTVVTTAVAGLSWAAGTLPAALSADASGQAPTTPSPWLIGIGAAAVGLLTGTLLGTAQALVLRGHTPHPWRWITASAVAWPLPMAVIFLGAGTAGPSWPLWQVLVLAAATGAVAGALLGAGLGLSAPSLRAGPVSGRLALLLLRSRAGRLVLPGVVGVAVRGRRTGTWHALPVAAADDDGDLVVLVGHADRKTWWRNLQWPGTVHVLRDGAWYPTIGRAVTPGDPAHARAARLYHRRFPRAATGDDAVFVRIRRASGGTTSTRSSLRSATVHEPAARRHA